MREIIMNENFEDFYANFLDKQEWLSCKFENMTHNEFKDFNDFIVQKTDLLVEDKDWNEFFRIKGLILAVAKKIWGWPR